MRHFPRQGSSRYLGSFVVLLAALCLSLPSSAQTLTVLHAFKSRPDGLIPVASVIMDQHGNLYGTTSRGGSGLQGTVFKIDTNGNETVLHSFVKRPDGLGPEAELLIDGGGNLFGTTQIGGTQNNGTIFKVHPDGTEEILLNFLCCANGINPVAGLTFDNLGDIFGTASNGGRSQDGTVFEILPSGQLLLLHQFDGPNGDGRNPLGTLLFDASGNLYGTTYQGGTQNSGTVFEMSNGQYRVVHRFGGGNDGKGPGAGVIEDHAGNLYGTTSGGGAHNGGTVFKLDTFGNETVLHSFGAQGDGNSPYGALVFDASGNLYGTTLMGGTRQNGTVFEISNTGNYTVLHNFRKEDGTNPAAGLIVGPDGSLYGTTSANGPDNGSGTVFKLSLH